EFVAGKNGDAPPGVEETAAALLDRGKANRLARGLGTQRLERLRMHDEEVWLFPAEAQQVVEQVECRLGRSFDTVARSHVRENSVLGMEEEEVLLRLVQILGGEPDLLLELVVLGGVQRWHPGMDLQHRLDRSDPDLLWVRLVQ